MATLLAFLAVGAVAAPPAMETSESRPLAASTRRARTGGPDTGPGGLDHSHAAFSRVLGRFSQKGGVDYVALQRAPEGLNAYLEALAAIDEKDFWGWAKPQQVAFLINLYNAQTLRLILDHYPKIDSIRDIGTFLKGPWGQPVVRLFGTLTTLDKLEKEVLLTRVFDARAHFALVCAAQGCPPLREDAYSGLRRGEGQGWILDEQLEEQGRNFLGARSKNRVDAASKTLYLSPIFKWFRKDFEKAAGSVAAFVRPYLPEQDRGAFQDSFRIRYTDYDWRLNDRRRSDGKS